ncbi:TIGR03085 family metal-binding protein [Streptosporangium sp. NBC_01755]|uniref:TIGR03085 family metal-binding protein n=1 Tax=Streptosporangium sp. NBC_01755 TaxID=2975949 RepID=UPI002DD98F60|nr:TIGR03085 family metal-binding protein [Streptosporangium sp. NBC_01755]WSC99047.1 TIGR03085 family metal-binding protein [Streptosporangium sp. NBC_01755]
MNHARAERAALSDLFAQLGPDAPTLCEGWTTFDLAAHLVLRERRADALGGILLKPLAGYTDRVQESLKTRKGYPGLVELVRSGPSGLYRLPGLDQTVNATEFFIHHEDVRRAQRVWEPRELPADLEERFWKQIRGGIRVFLRRSPVRVVLHRIGGGVAIGGPKDAPRQVEVTGRAGELLLFCFGRQSHAKVDLSGDDEAVAKLMDAPLGV